MIVVTNDKGTVVTMSDEEFIRREPDFVGAAVQYSRGSQLPFVPMRFSVAVPSQNWKEVADHPILLILARFD
jgi:hypothetical protein